MDSPTTAAERPTNVKLRQPWLTIGRILWVAFLINAIVVTIGYLPILFDVKLHPSAVEMSGLIQLGISPTLYMVFFVLLHIVYVCIFLTTASLIFWRRSHEGMALFIAIFLVNMGAYVADPAALEVASVHPTLGIFIAISSFLGWLAFFPFFLSYPDGRFVPRWTRYLLLAGTVIVIMWGQPTDSPYNPENWHPALFVLLLLGISGSLLYSQIMRYRRYSSPLQRQQTKWLIFCFAVYFLLQSSVAALSGIIASNPTPLASVAILVLGAISNFGLVFIPLALTLAMLRYRLWDIDYLINRSLVYGSLSLLLALVFGGILYVLSMVTQGQQSIIAVGGAAVAAGAFYQPARRRLQHLVDSRLYHIRIDYELNQPVSVRPLNTSMTAALKDTNFGQYRHLELIGRGGMAEVYKATAPNIDQPVAIKLLPPLLASDPDFRTRFQREAQTVSTLMHPNIVRMFDFGQVDDTHFMVMEYIAGQDLAHHLRSCGRLALSEVVSIVTGIAAALDYAHLQGLVHRDIKPSNIMIETTGDSSPSRAVLMDFGIAKIVSRHTAVTRSGVLIGTLDYIAPEQIQDAADVDGRADVYALGVMVYQLLTGELPFKQSNPGALLIAHMTQPPPDPRDSVPELPAHVTEVIMKALAKQPDQRFQTAGALAQALV